MTERHSSFHRRQARKAGFDYGNRFIRPSVSGGMGIDAKTQNLPPLLGARLGLPGFDRILAEKKAREYATKDELLEHMQYVIRSGKPSCHSHPDLAGMEFSPEQCDATAGLAIAAQMKASGDDSGLDALTQEALHAALFISATRPFRDACEAKDRRAQFRIALEAYAVELRSKDLVVRFGLKDAGEQAPKDIEMARNFVEEYRSPPASEDMVLRSVRRMRQLSKEVECIDLSDYEIALRVVDERHMKKEPPSIVGPPAGPSLPPIPAEPLIPPPSALPKDLQAPADAVAPVEGEVLAPEVEIDVDSLVEKAPGEAPEEGAEPTEPIIVSPVQDKPQVAGPEPVVEAPPPEHEEEPATAGEVMPAEPMAQAEEPMIAPTAPAVQAPELALPKFDFPFPNTVLDPALEPLLPPKDNPRNVLIRRVARALVFYKVSAYEDSSVDARCIAAVNILRASYSAQAAVDFAIAIVEGEPIIASAQAVAPAKSIPQILGEMNNSEKELVAGVMGVSACDEQALSGFISMAPANRELLMQRFIARRWIDGDFRTDISRFGRARESLYSVCSLTAPTPMENLAAIMDPALLSDEQKFLAMYLFHTSSPLTPKHIEALGVWVSSDPSTFEGRTRLGEYWNSVIVSAPANSFNITSGFWINTPHSDRLRLWHAASSDLLSAGSLAHRLRFCPGERFSFDEAAIVSEIYGKSWDEVWTLGDQSKQNLAMALTQHTYKDPNGGKSGRNVYYPEILALAKMPYTLRVPLPGKQGGVNPLHYAAMREMEYKTMLDFLGIPLQKAAGSLVLTHGSSKAKLGNGNGPKPNEDSWSCARVVLSDGTAISLDMVADGMGGHNQGSNGGKSNGQVASGIARDVFETAAVAGWIREPEDVRKIILIADLAIVLEQIKKKALGLAVEEVTDSWEKSGVDIANMHPNWVPEFTAQVDTKFAEHMRNTDPVQVNNMGTTMTVAFQRGKRLWFIHCGDSDGKLIRDGRILFNSAGHSAEYELRLGAQAAAREELAESYREKGVDIATLDTAGQQQFERELAALFEQRIEPMKMFFENNKNVVSSVLGVAPKYVHINNAESGAAPIEVEETDVIWVSSDGITVPVCDHEIPTVIYGKCMGDLDSARDMFISLAEARRSASPNPTLCECKERTGKNDDKTLTLRYAEQVLETASAADGAQAASAGKGRYAWLSRRIAENPTDFALSKSLRLVIEGCANPQLPKDELMQVFDVFINAAESAPPRTSAEAYSLAISSVFLTLSRRPDRDELITELVPRIGSWSGLILKKLRNSPDASDRKKAMFDLAAACVPADALESLLQARNAGVSVWAQEALGIELPVDGKQVTFASSDAPQSIFNSQTDEDGRPLDIWSTRYLDIKVVEIFGSTVVQDTAKKLGVLPRDLEIMAFYAYSDFQPQMAVDPHGSAAGQHLIASVGDHLCTGDGERILVASYLLYRLKETAPKSLEAKRMARELWKTMKAMDVHAPYSLMFYNKAYEHNGLLL